MSDFLCVSDFLGTVLFVLLIKWLHRIQIKFLLNYFAICKPTRKEIELKFNANSNFKYEFYQRTGLWLNIQKFFKELF